MRRAGWATTAAVVTMLGLFAVPPAGAETAGAAAAGAGSPNLSFVLNLPYAAAPGSDSPNGGTDIEFATIKGRDYALAGSYGNGMQIVDITDPENATIVGVYECAVYQGDVQVFQRRSVNDSGRKVTKTFAGYTMDSGYTADTSSRCYRQAEALGYPATAQEYGTFIADISKPSRPKTVSWVPFAQGSHNHTIDPSGKYIYNSNSDLITSTSPAIEIVDISKLATPRPVGKLPLPLIPGLGSESHDITFSDDGSRAYSAALSHTNVIDTSDLENPRILSTIVDPMINVHHQADPVTLVDKTTGRKRSFLLIEDEVAGAIGTGQCPNGGVHVWDITNETWPVKVGYWNIDDVGLTQNSVVGVCTAHVFDIHKLNDSEAVMTIAYYNGGVRVVDISGLIGVALGTAGVGMKEVGWYRFPDGNTWSAKTPSIAADGSFYLFGNDLDRGLDVYHYTSAAAPSQNGGTWLSAAEASRALPSIRGLGTGFKPFCLLGEEGLRQSLRLR